MDGFWLGWAVGVLMAGAVARLPGYKVWLLENWRPTFRVERLPCRHCKKEPSHD